MKLRKQIYILMLCLMGVCAFTGCEKRHSGRIKNQMELTTTQEKVVQSETVTGVIANLDVEHKQMVLIEIEEEWRHTLTYDIYTEMKSRYGEVIGDSQLEEGEIVEVTLDATDAKKIQSLNISYDAWEYEDVKGLTYSQADNTIQVKGEEYVYSSNLVVRDNTAMSNQSEEITQSESGKEEAGEPALNEEASGEKDSWNEKKDKDHDSDEQEEKQVEAQNMKLTDISRYDKVTCRGYKGKICSITVTAGHGYVRLSDYSTYIGGMVVIGEVMAEVTKDMVLTVPVGEWTLEIDKDSKMGTKQIVVEQNVEQTVNLSDLTIVACEKGIFHFVLSPANAIITIDDVEYTGRTEFMLEYGVHKVVVSAVNYKSYNGTIDLNVPYMNINVELEQLDAEEESTADTSVTTKEAATTTSSQSNEAGTTSQNNNTEQETTTQTNETDTTEVGTEASTSVRTEATTAE